MTLHEFRAAHMQEAERAAEPSSEQSAEPAAPTKKKGLFGFGGKDKGLPTVTDDSYLVSGRIGSSSSSGDGKQQLPLYVFQQDSEACTEGYDLLKQFGKYPLQDNTYAASCSGSSSVRVYIRVTER
jgi:hypothetical protein